MAKTGLIVIYCLMLSHTIFGLDLDFDIGGSRMRNCTSCPDLFRETLRVCNFTRDTLCGACIPGDEDYSYFDVGLNTSTPCLRLINWTNWLQKIEKYYRVFGWLTGVLIFLVFPFLVMSCGVILFVFSKAQRYRKKCTLLNTVPIASPDTSLDALGDTLLNTMPGAGCSEPNNDQNHMASRDPLDVCTGKINIEPEKKQVTEACPLLTNIHVSIGRQVDYAEENDAHSVSYTDDNNSLNERNGHRLLKTSDLIREAQDPRSQKAYPQLCKHILDVCEQVELSKDNDWSPVDFRKVVYKSDDRSFGACIVSKEEGAQINVGMVKLYIPPDSMPTDDLYLVYLYVEGNPRQGYNFRYGPHGLKLNHDAIISFPAYGYSIFQETDTSLYEQDEWEKSDMISVVDGGKKCVSLKHFSGGQDKSEQELQAAFNPAKARTCLIGAIFGPERIQKDCNMFQVCLIRNEEFEDVKYKNNITTHPKCITNWSYYGAFDLENISITVKSITNGVSAEPEKTEILKGDCCDNDEVFHICQSHFTFTRLPDSANKLEFTVSIQHEKDKAVKPVRVSLPYSGVNELFLQPPSESNPRLDTKETTLEGRTIKKLREILARDNRYIRLAEKKDLKQVLKQCSDEGKSKDQTVEKIFHLVYNGDAVQLYEFFKQLGYDDCMMVLREDHNYKKSIGNRGIGLMSGQSIESPSDQGRMSVEATDDN